MLDLSMTCELQSQKQKQKKREKLIKQTTLKWETPGHQWKQIVKVTGKHVTVEKACKSYTG